MSVKSAQEWDDLDHTLHQPSVDLCKKYSEEPERLVAWLETVTITIKFKGLVLKKWDDAGNEPDEKVPEWEVSIRHKNPARDKNPIRFPFWGSIMDGRKWQGHSPRHTKTPAYESPIPGIRSRLYLDLHKIPEGRAEVRTHLLYSVLCCCSLSMSTPETFPWFCQEFGYDEDSRRAHQLFQDCLKEKHALLCVMPLDSPEFLPR